MVCYENVVSILTSFQLGYHGVEESKTFVGTDVFLTLATFLTPRVLDCEEGLTAIPKNSTIWRLSPDG